jgi:hypothetical protein
MQNLSRGGAVTIYAIAISQLKRTDACWRAAFQCNAARAQIKQLEPKPEADHHD